MNLDDDIWTHRKSLLVLNVENNHLANLSSKIGQLKLLRNLNLARNSLRVLPPELGKCVHLKVLNVAHNMLKELPMEISWCLNLQEIYASNNKLSSLPKEINKLQELTILDVERNELEALPDTLCECAKLQTLVCEGNDCLAQIPKELRANTKLVLWICRKTKDHNDEMDQLTNINITLEDMARLADEEKLRLKDEILRLEHVKRDLEKERPYYYLKAKNGCKKAITSCTIS